MNLDIKMIKALSDEVLVARLCIVANNAAIIGESNELHELSSEVLRRMANQKSYDPDAIRRECAEAVEELKNTCLMHFPTPYEEGVFDGYRNAIDAIISLVKE